MLQIAGGIVLAVFILWLIRFAFGALGLFIGIIGAPSSTQTTVASSKSSSKEDRNSVAEAEKITYNERPAPKRRRKEYDNFGIGDA